MKRVPKGASPRSLDSFKRASSRSTWDQMRSDALWGGKNAYAECRATTLSNQGGLCAYCEVDIRDSDPLKCRIEHFHPKADVQGDINWALEWANMLAVCTGGSRPELPEGVHYRQPIAENLSCDAHKDRMITIGKLAKTCEGLILDPLQIPAHPNLVEVSWTTGRLAANRRACDALDPWPGNQFDSLTELVNGSIAMLNLNCDRLASHRKLLVFDIERNKRKMRQDGLTADDAFATLARKYFAGRRWPAFFSTIRYCLGSAADAYLREAGYDG